MVTAHNYSISRCGPSRSNRTWTNKDRRKAPLIAAFFLYFLAALLEPYALADPWPAAASGTNIGAGIGVFNAGFEASRLTYHPDRGYIVVGDDGDVAIVQSDASITAYQMLGGDFEGITVKPHAADLAYIASENLNAILEVSLTELSLTGKKWPLDIPQSGGLGFEGIAFVPADYAPASWGQSCCGGFFVAGTQVDSTLRVFDVDTNALVESALGSVATIPTDFSDVSGLHFSTELNLLYVLHDAANRLTVMTLEGIKIAQYETPTQTAEEGVVVVPNCESGTATVSLADDNGPIVMRYAGLSAACGASAQGQSVTPAVLWLLMRRSIEFEGM